MARPQRASRARASAAARASLVHVEEERVRSRFFLAALSYQDVADYAEIKSDEAVESGDAREFIKYSSIAAHTWELLGWDAVQPLTAEASELVPCFLDATAYWRNAFHAHARMAERGEGLRGPASVAHRRSMRVRNRIDFVRWLTQRLVIG